MRVNATRSCPFLWVRVPLFTPTVTRQVTSEVDGVNDARIAPVIRKLVFRFRHQHHAGYDARELRFELFIDIAATSSTDDDDQRAEISADLESSCAASAILAVRKTCAMTVPLGYPIAFDEELIQQFFLVE